MIKKSLIVFGLSVGYFLQAQNISTITNSTDVYSNGLSVNGSAKFNAMAGSTGALGGDANALLNNPAGLGVAISGHLSGTLAFDRYNNQSTLAGNSINYNKTTGDISNISGIASFQLLTESNWKFVNLGVNFSSRNLDNYVETPGSNAIVITKALEDSNGNPFVGNLTYKGHAYNRTGHLSKMSLGLGANYDNQIYLGAGINIHSSQLDQFDSARFNLDLDNSNSVYDKQYTPFSETSSGFSANVGVIGKVNNMLRIGAAIETPIWWNIERAYTNYDATNGNTITSTFGENRNFRSPLKATLSASMVPNKNFAINVDYSLGLTKPHYAVAGPAEEELNSFFNDNFKNSSEFRVGAEYRIKALRLRGGYALSTSPYNEMTITAYNNNGVSGSANFNNLFVGKRDVFGLGLGYDFKSIFVDASYNRINSVYNNPFLRGSSQYGTGYYSGDFDVVSNAFAVSEVQNKRNNFAITLGWKF